MRKYSIQTNQRTPDVTVSDVINNKQDDIHSQMYNSALSLYMSYAGLSDDDYRFVELRSSYFDDPSRVQVISKSYPYKRKTVDLTPWWGEYDFKDRMSYLKIDEDDMTVKTAEIVYKNYVTGEAELYSRYSGKKFKVDMKDIPNDVKEIDDSLNMRHTFGYKVQKKIYGRDPYGGEG